MGEQYEKGMDVNQDTINPQETVVEEQIDEETPVETPNVDEETPSETSEAEEKLYAGVFKSVEDLEAGYVNSNREATRMAQELSKGKPTPEPEKSYDPDDVMRTLEGLPDDQLERIAEENPKYAFKCAKVIQKREINNLLSNATVADIQERADTMVKSLTKDYPELNTNVNELATLRSLVPQTLQGPEGQIIAMERYRERKELESSRSKQAEIKNETEQEVNKNIVKKKKTMTPTPKGASASPPAKTPKFEDMRDVVDHMQKTGEDKRWKFFA